MKGIVSVMVLISLMASTTAALADLSKAREALPNHGVLKKKRGKSPFVLKQRAPFFGPQMADSDDEFARPQAGALGAIGLAGGTDTGNGSRGSGGKLMPHLGTPRSPWAFPRWCNAIQGWLTDIILMTAAASNLAEARGYLTGELQAVLSAYDQGSLPMQPLTYSILSRALKMQATFPHGSSGRAQELGDQVAVLLLEHMISVAKRVNQDFDIPKLMPVYQYYYRCGRNCDEYEYSNFYVDYINSAKAVLNEFYAPAIPQQPELGKLLDAMAYDRWELASLGELLDWMISDLSRSMFQRSFDCVVMQLRILRERLSSYLSGGGQNAIRDDRRMRQYVEASLGEVLNVLNNSTYNEDAGMFYCAGYRPLGR